MIRSMWKAIWYAKQAPLIAWDWHLPVSPKIIANSLMTCRKDVAAEIGKSTLIRICSLNH